MTLLQLSDAHIVGTIISYLLGVFIVPLVITFSKKRGLVDNPGERKIHEHPVSRLGGVSIWVSTMLTFLLLVVLSFYPKGSLLSGILLGGSLMFFLGLVDDIYCLNAKFKLLIQISIATIVFLLGIRIDNLYNPFGDLIHLNLIVSYIITILWIVGISNAVNFIDGIDGLAGSIITISSVTLGVISLTIAPSNVSSLIAFILAGSMLAFLTYNFNPAKIFMGDSGALFGGFMLSVLSITGLMHKDDVAMYLPLLILSVPIIDITFSSLRRIAKGSSPFIADSEHVHHKLLHAGFTQNKTVFVLAIVAIVSGALASLVIDTAILKYFLYAVAVSVILLILSFFARQK
ncbi:undecaprenyl/decaprenyl-phosphate alpha-N-acetylglucosaminyl 1-phosphate transferase [bacterium]|nr:undecaprenyl/decaprenyl-phosphate alpha-N-acetylglucosaminyl 1-phosphate transferase [bacterium]